MKWYVLFVLLVGVLHVYSMEESVKNSCEAVKRNLSKLEELTRFSESKEQFDEEKDDAWMNEEIVSDKAIFSKNDKNLALHRQYQVLLISVGQSVSDLKKQLEVLATQLTIEKEKYNELQKKYVKLTDLKKHDSSPASCCLSPQTTPEKYAKISDDYEQKNKLLQKKVSQKRKNLFVSAMGYISSFMTGTFFSWVIVKGWSFKVPFQQIAQRFSW